MGMLRKLILGGVLVALSTFCYAQDEARVVKELECEIKLLNLINGLYLTQEQMEGLLARAREVEKIREELKKKIFPHANSFIEALKDLRDDLMMGDTPSEETIKKVARLNHARIETIKTHKARIEEIAKETKQILTPHQIILLRRFRPCLIPPKDPSVLRIGQAPTEGKKGVGVLRRVRALPDHIYAERKERIIERILVRMKKKGRLEEEAIRERLEDLFEKVRELDDIEFELTKEELIKEFLPKGKKMRVDETRVIARFLLNPKIIPILEARLRGSS
jgi:hypothetical protein